MGDDCEPITLYACRVIEFLTAAFVALIRDIVHNIVASFNQKSSIHTVIGVKSS
jgi:hypothetical protein